MVEHAPLAIQQYPTISLQTSHLYDTLTVGRRRFRVNLGSFPRIEFQDGRVVVTGLLNELTEEILLGFAAIDCGPSGSYDPGMGDNF